MSIERRLRESTALAPIDGPRPRTAADKVRLYMTLYGGQTAITTEPMTNTYATTDDPLSAKLFSTAEAHWLSPYDPPWAKADASPLFT